MVGHLVTEDDERALADPASKPTLQAEMLFPLRAVLCRRFVAYEGTHVTLSCGHVLIRSRGTDRRKMRCPKCAADRARAASKDGEAGR
jgi:hypothetical protein